MGGRDGISWDEIKALISALAEQSKETDRLIRALKQEIAEQGKQIAEQGKQIAEQGKQIAEQGRQIAEQGKETDRKLREIGEQIAEQGKQLAEENMKTDRQLRELGRQIGGIGDKFGYFAEGMALPTMEKILRRKFRMENVAPRHRIRKGNQEREYDVLAWANGEVNTVIVVEVKSRVKRAAVGQTIEQIESLFEFIPELKGKRRMGILAGIDWDAGVEDEAQEAGLYTARIRDEIFELTTPKGFKPRRW